LENKRSAVTTVTGKTIHADHILENVVNAALYLTSDSVIAFTDVRFVISS
jgi:hypothetical protein